MEAIGCHEHEYGWLVERAGCEITQGYKAIKAVDAEGRIHGMVGFGSWTENSCAMTIALENPAALRELLKWSFRYLFEQTGRRVGFALVREKNTRSMRLCKHVGFREVARLRDAISVGEDMVVFEMRRENCRWVSEEVRKAA